MTAAIIACEAAAVLLSAWAYLATERDVAPLLAQLGPDVLGQIAEVLLDRMDAAEAFDDREEDNEESCPAAEIAWANVEQSVKAEGGVYATALRKES